MELKVFLTVFITIFLAELGDKSQVATLLFSADQEVSRWIVFLAASLALITVSAIGVLAGGLVSQFMSPKVLSYVAGIGFLIIGVVTLIKA